MSQSALARPQARQTARPLGRPAPHRPSPLRLVPTVANRPGTALFASLCAMLLAAGLIGILMLNTTMAEGSYRLHALEATSGELADTQEALTQAIDAQQAPAALAVRARDMGMVPAESTAYLRLEDGKVLGVATPAKKDTTFTVVTNPTTSAKTRAGSGPGTTVVTKGTVTTTTVVSSTPSGGLSSTITTVDSRTGETKTRTVETPAGSRSATTTSGGTAGRSGTPPVAD